MDAQTFSPSPFKPIASSTFKPSSPPTPKSVEEVFQSLNSQHLKVYSHSQTRAMASPLYPLRKLALTWQPPTEVATDSGDCSPVTLKQKLFLTTPSSPADDNLEREIQAQWDRCETQWRNNAYSPWTQTQQILRTDFEPSQHPEVRMIQWTFKNNSRLRGYLFFKGGPEKKPLVIFRTGIFSHLRSAVAERFLMMMLFEEGPFHLLLLPSSSGADYIENNHQIGFGDESEHEQTSEILDQIQNREEPLNHSISRIHLVGMSLGNYGLFLTNARERKKPSSLIGRSLFLCPAIDLKSSFNQITQNRLKEFILRLWFYLRLSSQKELFLPSLQDSVFDFIQTKVNQNPNTLINLLPHYDFTHSLIMWTQLDPVLPSEYNAKIFNQFKASSSHLLEFPRGLHCSLPTAYQWPMISLTLRGYLSSPSLSSSTAQWTRRITMAHPIQKIVLHDLILENHNIKFYLLIHFQNPLRPPTLQEVAVPQALSFHNWAFADFNEELKKSVLREFSSRLQWKWETPPHSSLHLSFY